MERERERGVYTFASLYLWPPCYYMWMIYREYNVKRLICGSATVMDLWIFATPPGYFGPARVVFALLDGSDDGNISWDEFRELEKCPR
eukprot:Skav214515  [mRNA]  locus=scaffold410:16923:17186:+ [translate_table: standard]